MTSSAPRDPSFDPSLHRIIPLADLLAQKQEALHIIKQEFQTKGWCIVQFPSNSRIETRQLEEDKLWGKPPVTYHKFPLNLKKALEDLTSFFAQTEQNKAQVPAYSSVPHKESIHITTPLPWVNPSLPPSSSPSTPQIVLDWCTMWDAVSVELIDVLARHAFGCSGATLAHRADLPVAWSAHHGMLDVAHYLNKRTATLSDDVGYSTQDVNCVPHYDPGLLSISFFSTAEGLQLKDPATGAWFAGPVNTVPGHEEYGVIWLGEAAAIASKGVFKEGVHRVVYPQNPVPRISVWYEVCTTTQVNEEIASTLPTNGTVQLHNLPNSKPLTLSGDSRQIERHYGIPMSKSGRPFKNQSLRAAYSQDKEGKKGVATNNMWGSTKIM